MIETLFKIYKISVDRDNCAAPYFKAVKIAFLALKLHDGGEKIISGLEEGLGLKDPGLSLETVINAMGNPDGEEKNGYSAKKPGLIHINDAGIYRTSLA